MENVELNKEVVETAAEEVVAKTAGMSNGMKVAAGAAGGVLVGGLLYKFVVRPVWGKIQDKRNERKAAKAKQVDDTAEKVENANE